MRTQTNPTTVARPPRTQSGSHLVVPGNIHRKPQSLKRTTKCPFSVLNEHETLTQPYDLLHSPTQSTSDELPPSIHNLNFVLSTTQVTQKQQQSGLPSDTHSRTNTMITVPHAHGYHRCHFLTFRTPTFSHTRSTDI